MAAQGKALLVGLKKVDSAAYGGWSGEGGCWGCELDVDSMEAILAPLGYDIQILKTEDATAGAILKALKSAAAELRSGDIFVFYFSGHGGQQPDKNGDEMDGQDETLVAYDRQIIDDELNELWLEFRAGVRVVMISDSCNSGTNYKNRMGRASRPTPFVPVLDFEISQKLRARLIHLGGCRDGFGSGGYPSGGAFTMALCDAWDGGAFRGNYPEFHQAICARISTSQEPQYNQYGSNIMSFRNERPFAIRYLQIPETDWEYEIEPLHPWPPLGIPPWLQHQLIEHQLTDQPYLQATWPGGRGRPAQWQRRHLRASS